jgi:putative sigma-54 modulation protein
MRVRIASRSLEIDPDLREHVQRRIGFALGRFATRIRQVEVDLEDLNGPRGGVDAGCRVRVSLLPSGELRVTGTEVTARQSADRTIDRAARRLARHLGLQRDQREREQATGGAS